MSPGCHHPTGICDRIGRFQPTDFSLVLFALGKEVVSKDGEIRASVSEASPESAQLGS